jgi:hypothetical protein
MSKNDNKLLTEKQAAEYFGWSLFTMREIRKKGEIEFIQFNEQTIRYTVEMLEDYKNRFLKQAA